MASPLGFNVTEFIVAIRKSKQIYDTFYDEYDKAPEQIKLLVSTSKYLHDILSESESLLKQCDRTYPGHATFIRRLNETDAFIRRHCTLVEGESDGTGSPLGYQRMWHTLKYAFGERRAKKIHDGLMIEMQKFITFILMLALRSNVSPAVATRVQATISGRLQPEDSSIEDIVRRLGEIRYKVERRQNQAIQLDRDPDISDLQYQLDQEWRLLCLRAGFVHPGHIPPLPGGNRNLLLSSAQAYQDMVVAMDRGTLNSPRGEVLTSSPIASPLLLGESFEPSPGRQPFDASEPSGSRSEPKPLVRTPSISSAGTIMPPVEPGLDHNAILGDPALPICVASFAMGDKYSLKLQHWKIFSSEIGRVLKWTGTRSANMLEHYLPTDIMPYTKHSSFKPTEKEYTLTFQGSHRVKWTKDGTVKLDASLPDATYSFVQYSDFKRFQEELRDKHLLGVFDFDRIKTHRSSNYGEAGNQDMKLWCSKDGDQTHTISFYANHIREHLEFPLHWFSSTANSVPEKRTLQLYFIKKPDAPESITRTPSFLRRFSGSKSPSSDIFLGSSYNWAVGSPSSPSPLASVSTFDSILSAHGSANPSRIQSLAQLAEKLRYLNIEFTAGEDKDDEDDSFDRFTKALDRATATRNSVQVQFSTRSPAIAESPAETTQERG